MNFNNEGRDVRKTKLEDLTEKQRDALNKITPLAAREGIRLGERISIIEQQLNLLAVAGVQFFATGNGDEVGLILPEVNGNKTIITIENGELVTDVSPI